MNNVFAKIINSTGVTGRLEEVKSYSNKQKQTNNPSKVGAFPFLR